MEKMERKMDEKLFGQLKVVDFEYLVQLNGLLADHIEEQGEDSLSQEMEIFNTTLCKVVHTRCNELIGAEKKLKDILEKDEDEIEYEDEARELVESLNKKYNGKIVENEVLEISDRLRESIFENKSFKSTLDAVKTIIQCTENGTVEADETIENAIFASYIAIWDVLNWIVEKDWVCIEEFEDVKEEDVEVKDFLLEFIINHKGLDIVQSDVEWLVQCGFDDIYVRELFDKEGQYCVILTDSNENRLTDLYYLY